MADIQMIKYITYEPRFKHFRPPYHIKIFKWNISMLWAYKPKIHFNYDNDDEIIELIKLWYQYFEIIRKKNINNG
jgi:hypothetical protein